jgi:hypothetical protein
MTWNCSRLPGSVSIDAFFDLAAEHVHFASMESPQGLHQKLLTSESPHWTVVAPTAGQPLAEEGQSGFVDYLKLGFRHIAGGADHVIFLLGLLLLCRRFADVAWAITGFTLGHSITLSLAALGLVQANVAAIESTIGLTIALVAIERTANVLESALPLALVRGHAWMPRPTSSWKQGTAGWQAGAVLVLLPDEQQRIGRQRKLPPDHHRLVRADPWIRICWRIPGRGAGSEFPAPALGRVQCWR